jgi:hypothetical protein
VKSLLRRRPSPALVIALIALFVSLSGVSYGVATGFIDSREIKNNQVRSLDIRNNEVRTRDLRNNEVRGIDIRNSTVQSRDIALNAVTGDDVKEDTLQKVPGALLADTATRATSAGGLDGLRLIDASVARGAPDAVLATNGPLTLLGRCVSDLSSTNAAVLVDTSENGTFVSEQTGTPEPDLDAAEPPYPVLGVSDPPGNDERSAALALFHASAPSGPVFVGNVSIQANATSVTAGTCRFQGFVTLPR